MILKTVFHMELDFQAMSSFRTLQIKNQSTMFFTDVYTSTVKMPLAQTNSVQTQQQKRKMPCKANSLYPINSTPVIVVASILLAPIYKLHPLDLIYINIYIYPDSEFEMLNVWYDQD